MIDLCFVEIFAFNHFPDMLRKEFLLINIISVSAERARAERPSTYVRYKKLYINIYPIS